MTAKATKEEVATPNNTKTKDFPAAPWYHQEEKDNLQNGGKYLQII